MDEWMDGVRLGSLELKACNLQGLLPGFQKSPRRRLADREGGGRCLLGLNGPGKCRQALSLQPSAINITALISDAPDGLFARGWHESTTFGPCCSHLRCLPIISHLCHTFLATSTSTSTGTKTSTLRASPKLACATTPWRSRSLAA